MMALFVVAAFLAALEVVGVAVYCWLVRAGRLR
jgi:hypothetical protein